MMTRRVFARLRSTIGRTSRAVAAGIVVVHFLAPLARAEGPADPFVFEPVSKTSVFRVEKIDDELEMLQSFSFSADGNYVALARTPATVHVWSPSSGRQTLSQTLGGSDRSVGHVALVGEPCTAIVGTDAFETSKAMPLQAYSCETGELLATVPAKQLPPGLLSLTPVHACGLVVASFSGGEIVVYDTAKRSLRADLAKLFTDLTPRVTPGPKRYGDAPLWALAGPSPTACLVNAVLSEYRASAKQLAPAALYRFDLRAGQVRLLNRIADDRHVAGFRIMPLARLMTSPSGNTNALLFQRVTDVVFQNRGPLGTADLVVVKQGSPPKIVDMRRHGSAIRGIAILNEREVLLNTWLMDLGNVVSVFDIDSQDAHTICNSDFTNWKKSSSDDEGPTAIGVDASRNVMAVVFKQTVRVYRYRRDPTRAYAGQRLCNRY